MGTKTRFEEEAKGNSEMAYCMSSFGKYITQSAITIFIVCCSVS